MATIVAALGGNAILRPGQKGTYQEQLINVSTTAEKLVELIASGHKLVITHGNGPQVGNLLIQHEAGKERVPALPLDICGAQTQGQIGYMIQQCLSNFLREENYDTPVVSLVTRVRIAADDPAYTNPSKPVGPFFGREYAEGRMALGESWIEDSGRGWRRVVPSPHPVEIIELDVVKTIVNSGGLVITAGGGGIPVLERDGRLEGVEAVIDKDSVACRLACDLDADVLLILTDVERVAINYGTPQQIDLDNLSVAEAESYIAQGQFGKGSMGPKVQAAVDFVKNTGKRAIITSLTKAVLAVEGNSGTVISP